MNEKSFISNRVWNTWFFKRDHMDIIKFIKTTIGINKGNTSIVWTCSQSISRICKSRDTMKGGCLYGYRI